MERWLSDLATQPANPDAEAAIEYCKRTGIMVGDPDGNFRPKSPVKREEMAWILKGLLTDK